MNKQSSNGVIMVEEQGWYVQSVVNYIKQLDRDDRYYIISMRTNFSKIILLKNFISKKKASCFALIMDGTIETRGKALLIVFSGLGGYWRLLAVLKILPGPMQDMLAAPIIYFIVSFFQQTKHTSKTHKQYKKRVSRKAYE